MRPSKYRNSIKARRLLDGQKPNLEEDDNTVHEGNDVRRWHIATNPKAQNLRSVLMQSGHLWT
ncbi:MAG: hypothetical protein WBL43_10280, partial [Pseudolabrys sp.]